MDKCVISRPRRFATQLAYSFVAVSFFAFPLPLGGRPNRLPDLARLFGLAPISVSTRVPDGPIAMRFPVAESRKYRVAVLDRPRGIAASLVRHTTLTTPDNKGDLHRQEC